MNGDSYECDFCKDNPLGYWWEAVPNAHFPVCLSVLLVLMHGLLNLMDILVTNIVFIVLD